MSWGERTVEVPWFLSRLTGKSVMDIGSAESCYVNELVEKYDTILLTDIRQFRTHENEPKVSCLVQDVRKCSPESIGTYDTVLCISTLEHVALTAYEQKEDWRGSPFEGQKEAFEHFMKFVKPGGKFILTVPYGKYEHGGWVIVYNKEMVDKLKALHPIVEETYFTLIDRANDTWKECKASECQQKGMDHWNGHMRATNVACLIFTK